jgi:hypothetical protein
VRAVLKVAFHSNQLSLTGTETALYDYAHCNETLLGNRSIVIFNRLAPNNVKEAVEKFAARFPLRVYDRPDQIDDLMREEKVDLLYCIKAGFNDGIFSRICKTAVHVVFEYRDPHGDVYAYVSEWLARYMSGGELPFVPHMVTLPESREDLRAELGIPPEAVVFGRHGGATTFDIPFARVVVEALAQRFPDLYFVFLYTQPFCAPRPNIIFLDGTTDPLRKVKFINSCDAMLHARFSGETFGLAVGEFSIRNKPVITWADSPQRSHIEILADKGVYYHDHNDLIEMLSSFRPQPEKKWDAYSARFSPAVVMECFKRVFIEGAAL